jgi:hypothetical protein
LTPAALGAFSVYPFHLWWLLGNVLPILLNRVFGAPIYREVGLCGGKSSLRARRQSRVSAQRPVNSTLSLTVLAAPVA